MPLNERLFLALFHVTDRLRKLKNEPHFVTLAEYREILTHLCRSLSDALDHGIDEAVYASAATDPNRRGEAEFIIKDVNAFMSFLQFEKDLLRKVGVSEATANDMIQEVINLSTQLSNFNYDPDRIMRSIVALRENSCHGAQQAERYVADVKQLAVDKKRTLMTYGTALTIANATATAIAAIATMGAAAPSFLTVSGIAGGLLVTWRTTIDDPTLQPPR